MTVHSLFPRHQNAAARDDRMQHLGITSEPDIPFRAPVSNLPDINNEAAVKAYVDAVRAGLTRGADPIGLSRFGYEGHVAYEPGPHTFGWSTAPVAVRIPTKPPGFLARAWQRYLTFKNEVGFRLRTWRCRM